MPFISVILKSGVSIIVRDADTADWINELAHRGTSEHVIRLVCKSGDQVLARFDAGEVAGYMWTDGRPGNQ